MEITAAADIDPGALRETAKTYHIPEERCFTSAEELLAQLKMADAVFICTQDRDHVSQALTALERGYHILMENPSPPDPLNAAGCWRLPKNMTGKSLSVTYSAIRRSFQDEGVNCLPASSEMWSRSRPLKMWATGIRPTALSAVTGETVRRPAPCAFRRHATISTSIYGWLTRRRPCFFHGKHLAL